MDMRVAKDLQWKIQELESAHVCLEQEISKLLLSRTLASDKEKSALATAQRRHASYSDSWKRNSLSVQFPPTPYSGGGGEFQLNGEVYLNILQSMGQSLHVMNMDSRIIYWNQHAHNLYGYSAAEALGNSVFDLLVEHQNIDLGSKIVDRVKLGESWTGLFPVKSKMGRKFSVTVNNTPLYDEDGTIIGIICVATDSKPFEDMRFTLPNAWDSETNVTFSRARNSVSTNFGLDPDQPLQDAIASKVTDLASKVSNKVRSKLGNGKNIFQCEVSSTDSHGLFGTTSKAGELVSKSVKGLGEESEGRARLQKITSKAEAWISKECTNWPRKRNQQEISEAKSNRSNDLSCSTKSEFKAKECGHVVVHGPGELSSLVNVSCAGNVSRSISSKTTSSSAMKLDMGTDYLDYEIFQEDLTFKEQIGQGSCGTVYHGLWCGSDVAIKVFPQVEYSEDAIHSFRQEVSIMRALRHPYILLFMGAVMSPQCLCIITEFLPRGSLFRLLQKKVHKLDWKRRVHMALDIARGMNYLHQCNPPIVHRDLKSSNLLVDKNWNVKVADFGLSRIKHETYLSTRTGKGTPQWMAPEVLRFESADEKSDIYSFGVILWELATQKMPWEDLNAMQVIGAVGFRNQRLDIPSDVDPRWAALIESCWQSSPRDRPSFGELLKTLKYLARKNVVRSQAPKSGVINAT